MVCHQNGRGEDKKHRKELDKTNIYTQTQGKKLQLNHCMKNNIL